MATVTPTMMAVLSLSVRHAQRILSVTMSQTIAKNNRVRYVCLLKRMLHLSYGVDKSLNFHSEILPASSNPWADMYTK